MSPDLQACASTQSLMRLLCKRGTLFQAWRKVRENGIHSLSDETRQEVHQFDAVAAKRLDQILHRLSRNRFQFHPQKGIAKRRAGKSPRPLVVAAVENRVVQRALLDVLQSLREVQEILAIKTSIGGVKGRGREHAMALVREALARGSGYYLRSDIEGFFTKIPRDSVLKFIGGFIWEPEFLDLLGRATETELANLHQLGDDALLFPTDDFGVAQGSPLSPLFGNILLHDFDREMNGRGITCIRYIDDFLLLGPNPRAIEKAFGNAQRILGKFGLRAYEPPFKGKAEAGSVKDGFDFLGCTINAGLIQPSRDARQKIIQKLNSILAEGLRSIAASLTAEPTRIPKQRYAQTLDRLDRVLRGWGHAYAFCDGRQSFGRIDDLLDVKIAVFRRRTTSLLHGLPQNAVRRGLGVYLLADTPVIALPTSV